MKRVCRNCLARVRRNQLGKTTFLEDKKFSLFSFIGLKLFGLPCKNVGKFVDSAFYISRKTFRGQNRRFFWFLSRFWAEIFPTSGWNLWASNSELHRTSPEESLEGNIIVGGNFFLFWDFERKALGLSAEKYWHGCWNWLLTFHRTFIWTITKKIFRFFSDFGLKFFGHLA